MAKNRGKRPQPSGDKLTEPAEPPNYDNESPKFCLRFLHGDFDVHSLDAEKQASFAKTLQKLASKTWKELKLAPKHGIGTELLPATVFKPSIPPTFQDELKFMVFRYHGNLPMAGVRVRDVYHVLWIEPDFNSLYDHGSS